MKKHWHLISVIENFILPIKAIYSLQNIFREGENKPVTIMNTIYFHLLHILYMCYHQE